MKPVQRTGEWIRQAMARHGQRVYALAFARTRSAFDAEDIYQEVFLRLLTCDTPFESEEHLKAWLIRVTHNLSCNLLRSAWRRLTVTLPPEQPVPAPAPECPQLHGALEKLSPRCREIIHLFYYEDMDVKDIGEILGMRPSAVRAQLTRGRQKLKAQLEKGGQDHA